MLRIVPSLLFCVLSAAISEGRAQTGAVSVPPPIPLILEIGAATARVLGVNGDLYPGTVANVNGQLHIGDPNATFQPDGAQLTVRNDAPGGATFVIRGMNPTAGSSAVIGLATPEDDQTGKIVAYNANNTDFNGARSVFIGTSYGDLGIWGNYSGGAAPVNYVTIAGCIRATPGPDCNDGSAGYFGIGTVDPPQRLSVVGRTNGEVVSAGVYRTDLKYGVLLSTDGRSGNSRIATVGVGATLSLEAGGATSVTVDRGAVTVRGVLNVISAYQANGRAGLSTTKTVRDRTGTGTCTLVFTSGLLTGGTC